MSPNVTEAEVRGLALTMTLKGGFLRQLQGGAKAGVRFNPEAQLAERRQHLEAFGRLFRFKLTASLFLALLWVQMTQTSARCSMRLV